MIVVFINPKVIECILESTVPRSGAAVDVMVSYISLKPRMNVVNQVKDRIWKHGWRGLGLDWVNAKLYSRLLARLIPILQEKCASSGSVRVPLTRSPFPGEIVKKAGKNKDKTDEVMSLGGAGILKALDDSVAVAKVESESDKGRLIEKGLKVDKDVQFLLR